MLRSLTVHTSSYKRLVTGLYYSSFVLLGLMGALLGPTLPFLAENTQSSLQTISLVFVMKSFGYLLGALFVGRLYDSMPGHLLIVVMLVLAALALITIPLAPSLVLLLLLMLGLGVAASTTDIGANTLLVWLHRDQVGPYMNGLHFAFGVGAFLAPIVVAQAHLQSGTVTWAYWLVALLALPLLLTFLRFPSPHHEAKATNPVANVAQASSLVLMMAIFFFFYAGMEISFGNWIYTYAITIGIANEVWAAYLTSAFWGAFTLGRLVSIPLAIRLEPIRLLVLCLLATALFLALMLVLPFTAWALWLGSIGLGLSIAAIFPTMLAFAERRLDIQGRTMSTFFVGASLGGMTIPWLIGQVFESIHPMMLLVIVSSCGLISASLLALIWWRTRPEVQ